MDRFKKMIGELREEMRQRDIERMMVSSSPNLSYLTGLKDISGFLFVTMDKWEFLVSKFYRYGFENVSRARVFSGKEEMADYVNEKLEEGFLCDRDMDMDVETSKTDVLEEMRKVKRDFEIDRLRESCRINEKVFKKVVERFEPGMTEWEVVREIDSGFREHGCYNSFDTLAHVNTLKPHREPKEKEASIGDIVLVDMGCRYRNYCSDMTRIIPNGIEGSRKDLFKDVLEIQEFALNLLKPGREVSDICERVLEKVEEKGYSPSKNFLHSLGHGIGVEIHEPPTISTSSNHVIEEGNVFTIEPGLYVKDVGGVRIEDQVRIKEKGYEVLNRSDKRLDRLSFN